MIPDFSSFEKATKVSFKKKALLRQAFTHRSYLNEQNDRTLVHNERLEFLGDAVLELVITDYLYTKYPDNDEGDLTSFRSALVNTRVLSETAQELGMGDYLLLSKGEAKDEGKARQYILANTFEAVVGAIYIDQGYNGAHAFIKMYLFPKSDEIVEKGLWKDAKSLVQEKAQEIEGVTPAYQVLKEIGPDHNKNFTVGIFFDENLIADGTGKSKQEAEQVAAEKALRKRGWE
jgi:ribonuclease III